MRIALLVVMVVHASIHLLGLRSSHALAQRGLWLAASLLLLTAAGMLALTLRSWWLVAAGALVLSQALIILAWGEAKAGTAVNLMLLVAVVGAWADARFQREGEELAADMLRSAERAPASLVTAAELEPLPAPVRRWLESSGVIGRARTRALRLRQSGEMRSAPDQNFMQARADQYFSVQPPAFVWRVRVPMLRVFPVAGRDSYLGGSGHMTIKLASLVPIVDARGEAIDQGTLLRFLGELVWFPSAALIPEISWQPIDEHSARATMSSRGVTGSAVFSFDASGRMTQLSAERFMDHPEGARLTPWHVRCTEWQRFAGVEVPVRGEVSWQVPAGEFTYYRWQITALEYDQFETYD